MKIRENVLEVGCDICNMETTNILELDECNCVVICDGCLNELNNIIAKFKKECIHE